MGRFDSLTQLTKPPARPVPSAERSAQSASVSSSAPATPTAPDPVASTTSHVTTHARTRRDKIRHPFEIYQDQLDTLRERAYHERREGKTGSMSRMVREALDSYLNKPPSADD